MELEWIILVTDNFEASRAFYKDILALPIVREIPEEEFVQFQMKHCFLAIYGRSHFRIHGEQFKGSGGGAMYSLKSENLEKEYEELTARGVKFLGPPQTMPWGQKSTVFADPDGHMWEIQQWIKEAK